MPNAGGIAADRLRSFIERVERLNEDEAAIKEDKREVFAEAKAVGFDVKIMRKVIAARKMDPSERSESEQLFDLYMHALEGVPHVHVYARDAREAAHQNTPTGLIAGAGGHPSTPTPDAAASVGGFDRKAQSGDAANSHSDTAREAVTQPQAGVSASPKLAGGPEAAAGPFSGEGA